MGRILPVFLTFAACGNRCIFCDQNAISGVRETGDILNSAQTQMQKWFEIHKFWEEVAFYGGNFGALDKTTRLGLYKLARDAGIEKIRYSTRPDTVTTELLAEIKGEGVTMVELGIQSLNDETLFSNGRPYTGKIAIEAVEKICEATFCGAQLMTGMYGQSYISSVKDAEYLTNFPIKTARIYPTVVVKGTKLEKLMLENTYTPTKLRDIIAAAAGIYIAFTSADIAVIRMGLPFDGDLEENIAGGATHRSFGDIVKTFVAAIYCAEGGKTSFAGYKSFVRKTFESSYDALLSEAGRDFNKMSKELRSLYFADNERYFKGQASCIARELESAAND